MRKNNKLFIIWGVVVVVVIALLTTLGFIMKGKLSDYVKLEDKLETSVKKYVDAKFLYPTGSDTIKITSSELIANDYLDELKFEDDICEGYVIVSYNGVYNYDTYIKCNNYKTTGYKK